MQARTVSQKLPFLKQVHWFEELESTSDLGKTLARNARTSADVLASFPALIFATNQTKGRGRSGRSWFSTPDSLTFSVVLATDLLERHAFPIALAFGVVAAETLNRMAPPTRVYDPGMARRSYGLKWPNDLVIQSPDKRDQNEYDPDALDPNEQGILKKVGGILVEQVASGSGQRLTVIGCGINVNNRFRDDDPETGTWTSLATESGKDSQPTEILFGICEKLAHDFELGHSEQSGADIHPPKFTASDSAARWNKRFATLDCLQNRVLTVGGSANRGAPEEFRGIYQGLGADGQLILETEQGRISFHSGTILKIEGGSAGDRSGES